MNLARAPKALYAAIHAAEFPAQALLRLRPDLRSRPVAVLEGRAPHEAVCSMNSHARKRGVSLAMTRIDVEELNGLVALSRSEQSETAARAVLLECAAQFSPRIEEASDGTACAFVLDIAGTERLFGPPQRLAERLHAALLSAGFRASIAISANYDAARMKAEDVRGITMIPDGDESNALAKLPLAALRMAYEHYEIFTLWGIRTLGELATLPEVELVTRLGHDARVWRELARGEAGHTFQPIEAKFLLREFVEFETHVEQMDSLLFIGASMIDSLVARAAGRALSLAWITMHMSLEGGLEYERVIRPAIASTDRKFLLKLMQLEIAAHPPQAAVVSLTLTAEAGQSSTVQLGLFAPQTPEPSRLDVTLARLKALVGDDRVGSPWLEDTHRSGSFRMEGFAVDNKPSSPLRAPSRMALRRMRPPVPLRVVLHAMKPVAFRDGANRYEVTAAYGPWKTSGCWWSTDGWDAEEWDVMATNSNGEVMSCLLVLDHARNRWQLDALYD
jgi:protein ImuB